jgi:hypothetical protein
MPDDFCPRSRRVDGKRHSWRWDGDDPRIVCVFCDEVRDALNGRVLVASVPTEEKPNPESDDSRSER